MPAATLGELFSLPGFICLFLAILASLANIVVGINVHQQNKKHKQLHRYMYYAVVVGYLVFLNYYLHKNTWVQYGVLAYLLFVVPRIRGITDTQHAVLASVGVILLMYVAAFGQF